jgi:cell division protein FtsZ
MGGGTGTGAAPVIAEAARELGILTVAIVTIPFGFEGKKRRMQAETGLQELKKYVDTVLVVSNDKLREMYGNLKLSDAFSQADSVLTVGAKGIAEIITVSGYVNVDFEDVRTVMTNSGVAIMGSATASGSDRAMKAVQQALASPLLNDNNIKGARNILLYINSGSEEVSMDEVSEITDYIQDEAGMDADVIWGNGVDESLADQLSITVVATGFDEKKVTGVTSESQPQKRVFNLNEPTNAPTIETPIEPNQELRKPLLINPELENLSSDIKITDEIQAKTERTVYNLMDEVEEVPAAELTTETELEETFEETIEPLTNKTEITDESLELPTEDSFLEEDNLLNKQMAEPSPLPPEITSETIEDSEVLEETEKLEEVEPGVMTEAESTPEPTFTPEKEKPTMINFDLPKKVEEPKVKRMDLFEDAPANEVASTPEEPKLIRTSREEVTSNNKASNTNDLQQLQAERFERLRETASKFRTPASLTDLENVPAYKRRNVKLNSFLHSSENPVSKFTLTDSGKSEDGGNGGTDLRSNNSFLHDNVD